MGSFQIQGCQAANARQMPKDLPDTLLSTHEFHFLWLMTSWSNVLRKSLRLHMGLGRKGGHD